MSKTLQAVRGMNDLLPQDASRWQFLEDTTRAVFEQYGYSLMRTPIVEPTPLFIRSIGEVTDIVEKEMYSFEDAMNGEKLTLRPEATAGLVRAAIEHNILYEGPKRVWTWGPMFRHERPQKGRYRQFYQFDVEALGFAGPDVDGAFEPRRAGACRVIAAIAAAIDGFGTLVSGIEPGVLRAQIEVAQLAA